MDDVTISCNWTVCGGEKINKIITCSSKDTDEWDGLNDVTAETCTCLSRTTNGAQEDPKPELEIKSKAPMKSIEIFSEGILIEVFGVHGEYLATCECKFLDDWEGMAVFYGRIIMPSINMCRLKFARTKDKERLWIYNIRLSLFEFEKPSNLSVFDFRNVDNLINGSNRRISMQAEKFKKLFESYLSGRGGGDGATERFFDPLSVLQALPKGMISQKTLPKYRTGLGRDGEERVNAEEGARESEQEYAEEEMKSKSLGRKVRGKEDKEKSVRMVGNQDEFLKTYIDEKLEEVKREFFEYLNEKIRELRKENNDKLDKIIQLLEGSKL